MYHSPHIHVCWGNDIFVENDEEEVSEGQMKQLKQIEPMNQRIMEESVGISIGLSELVEVSIDRCCEAACPLKAYELFVLLG